MSGILIRDATVVLPDRLAPRHSVLVDCGRIVAVEPSDRLERCQEGVEVVDAANAWLVPGFIDLHIHGTGQFRIDHSPLELNGLCDLLPRYGVTGILATVCPRPGDEHAEYLRSLAALRSEGTAVLGFHLEGPFLSCTGAFRPEDLQNADSSRVDELIEATGEYPVVFSISPEFPGITDLIPRMARGGRPVFITHTRASVTQTQAAIEAGARHATHFYDVFPVPAETDPGVRPCGAVEAILADPRVSVDFILDGEHVDPVAVRMAMACKGPGGVSLITDANVGAGMGTGVFQSAMNEVEFKYPGGPARLTARSHMPGGLAGSGLTMNLAVANAVRMLGLSLPQAVRMASVNPAAVLGLSGRKGQVAVGFDADLALMDESFNVRRCWVAGRCCHGGKEGT